MTMTMRLISRCRCHQKGFLLVPFLTAKVMWASFEFDYTGYTRINLYTPKNVPSWSIQQANTSFLYIFHLTSWQRIRQSSDSMQDMGRESRLALRSDGVSCAHLSTLCRACDEQRTLLTLDRTFFWSSDTEKHILRNLNGWGQVVDSRHASEVG